MSRDARLAELSDWLQRRAGVTSPLPYDANTDVLAQMIEIMRNQDIKIRLLEDALSRIAETKEGARPRASETTEDWYCMECGLIVGNCHCN